MSTQVLECGGVVTFGTSGMAWKVILYNQPNLQQHFSAIPCVLMEKHKDKHIIYTRPILLTYGLDFCSEFSLPKVFYFCPLHGGTDLRVQPMVSIGEPFRPNALLWRILHRIPLIPIIESMGRTVVFTYIFEWFLWFKWVLETSFNVRWSWYPSLREAHLDVFFKDTMSLLPGHLESSSLLDQKSSAKGDLFSNMTKSLFFCCLSDH